MATFLRVSVLCVTLSALTVFMGCSKKGNNWLVGKWAFDMETTKANIPADNKAQGVPDNVAKQMGEQLTNQLISQMNNGGLHITGSKMTMTLSDGTQGTTSYKITKRPDANTMAIEAKDFIPPTFTVTRSGQHICMPSTGAVQFKMYFKPVN